MELERLNRPLKIGTVSDDKYSEIKEDGSIEAVSISKKDSSDDEVLLGGGGTKSLDEFGGNIAEDIHNADEKDTPVDDDEICIADSEDDYKLKKINLSSISGEPTNAYIIELSENPTYYSNGLIKIMKYQYVADNTKYYEERFEYDTNNICIKIEIKDDLNNKWVQKTDLYNTNDELIKPTITDITAWSII